MGAVSEIHGKHKWKIRRWEDVVNPIMTVKLTNNGYNIVTLGVYAPIDDTEVLMKDQCCEILTMF